jgi:hypothetical protein
MKKVVLVAVMGLLGLGASAQGFSGSVSNNSLSGGQQGSVTSSTTTTTTVGTKFSGVLMNSPDEVSGQFQNGMILMEGDLIEVNVFDNFNKLEFQGTVVTTAFNQIVAVGKDAVTGSSISITITNANTKKANEVFKVEIPATGDVFTLLKL